MNNGFDASRWGLEQVALWIALRSKRLVDEARAEDVYFSDMLPDPHVPTDEETEIFAAVANPPGLGSLVATSPLLAEIRGHVDEAELDRDLRGRLVSIDGPITLRHVLDLLSKELESGWLPSVGWFDGEPTHRQIRPEEWITLRVRMKPGLPLRVQTRDGVGVTDVCCRSDHVLNRFPGLERTTEAERRRRAKGSGPYRRQDLFLVEKMRQLVVGGEAPTVHAAAWKVLQQAEGISEPESKVKRLSRRYKQTYPDT